MNFAKMCSILMALAFSLTLAAQKSGYLYAHASTQPGLLYGKAGLQYEKIFFTKKSVHLGVYAGLKIIWGGHFYHGLAYPSLPVGLNLAVGKEKNFFELGFGAAYFWELGYKPEMHIAYKKLFHLNYFLKLLLHLDWIKTTSVYPVNDDHKTFKNMVHDILPGIAVGIKI